MTSYQAPEVSGPSPVLLHVYDVTNASSNAVNTAVAGLNRLTKDILGLGGVFHGGIEVHGREYSYGFVETGSGVYPCSPRCNPMYKYRETVELGTTAMSPAAVRALIAEMSLSWSGASYSLLTRNCVHFCEELCKGLGCTKQVPAWVNAAAAGAESAARAASAAASAGRELVRGAKDWLDGALSAAASAVAVAPAPEGVSGNGNSSNSTGSGKRLEESRESREK